MATKSLLSVSISIPISLARTLEAALTLVLVKCRFRSLPKTSGSAETSFVNDPDKVKIPVIAINRTGITAFMIAMVV